MGVSTKLRYPVVPIESLFLLDSCLLSGYTSFVVQSLISFHFINVKCCFRLNK